MGIRHSVRDKLLVYSAGKCSKCKRNLLVEGITISNVGEVCHIISKKRTGPRHQPNLEDYDCYDNLILLCANCHKEIDTNVDEFTVERLKEIKTSHEKECAEKNKSVNKSAILSFYRIDSGTELGGYLWGCHCYQISYERLNEEGLIIFDELYDYINDLLNLQDYLLLNDKNEIYTHLQKRITELRNIGYFTYVAKTIVNNGLVNVSKLYLLIVQSTSAQNIYATISK